MHMSCALDVVNYHKPKQSQNMIKTLSIVLMLVIVFIERFLLS